MCAVQAVLVGVAVAPQLSARLTGEEYRLAVAPVDPVDPFRGAYVALDYPGMRTPEQDRTGEVPQPRGGVFVPLVRDGDVWRGLPHVAERPEEGPYLSCHARYRITCGIESLFAPQEEALRLERELGDGAVARIRVDGRGHAALLGIEDA